MRVHYHLSTPWGWKWKIKIYNLASFKNIKIFCENFIYNLSYIYNYKYLDINIYIDSDDSRPSAAHYRDAPYSLFGSKTQGDFVCF